MDLDMTLYAVFKLVYQPCISHYFNKRKETGGECLLLYQEIRVPPSYHELEISFFFFTCQRIVLQLHLSAQELTAKHIEFHFSRHAMRFAAASTSGMSNKKFLFLTKQSVQMLLSHWWRVSLILKLQPNLKFFFLKKNPNLIKYQ
jgi:hypothetical protein